MVKALDNDISISEIIKNLKEFSNKDISGNVLNTLEQWERDSKRIKIRTVTIVETDDKFLLEELKSYDLSVYYDSTEVSEFNYMDIIKIKNSFSW